MYSREKDRRKDIFPVINKSLACGKAGHATYTPIQPKPEVAWKRGLRALARAKLKNHGGKHQGLARHKPFSRRYSVFLRKKWRRRKQVDNSTIKILVKMPKIESTGIKERPCRKVGFVT